LVLGTEGGGKKKRQTLTGLPTTLRGGKKEVKGQGVKRGCKGCNLGEKCCTLHLPPQGRDFLGNRRGKNGPLKLAEGKDAGLFKKKETLSRSSGVRDSGETQRRYTSPIGGKKDDQPVCIRISRRGGRDVFATDSTRWT